MQRTLCHAEAADSGERVEGFVQEYKGSTHNGSVPLSFVCSHVAAWTGSSSQPAFMRSQVNTLLWCAVWVRRLSMGACGSVLSWAVADEEPAAATRSVEADTSLSPAMKQRILAAKDVLHLGHAEGPHVDADPVPVLQKLPIIVCNLRTLQVLHLHRNALRCLPEEVGSLISLRELDVSENQLSSLPPALRLCTHLETLIASENRITSLPPRIGELHRLRRLILFKNELATLPDELAQCASLQEVGVAREFSPMRTSVSEHML